MNELDNLRKELQQYTNKEKAINHRKFFKNSANDLFLGVAAADIRKLAKKFAHLTMHDILLVMKSNIHDERSISNSILCINFKKSDDEGKTQVFNFYIKNRKY